MKKKNKKKILTDWDWTTLVAAWRYYEHRNTITEKCMREKEVGK